MNTPNDATLYGQQLKDNQSLAASFETSAFRIKYADNVGINIACESVTDNTGMFCVYHRIVKDGVVGSSVQQASSWAKLSFVEGDPTLSDTDDVFFINLNQIPPGEIKVTFTAAGGTPDGTCDIWLSAATLGA